MAKKRLGARKPPHGDKYANLATNKTGPPKRGFGAPDGPVDIERTLLDIRMAATQSSGFTQFAEEHNRRREEAPAEDPATTGHNEPLSRQDQERYATWPEYQ